MTPRPGLREVGEHWSLEPGPHGQSVLVARANGVTVKWAFYCDHLAKIGWAGFCSRVRDMRRGLVVTGQIMDYAERAVLVRGVLVEDVFV